MIGRVCLETIAYITPDIPIGHISTLVDSSVLRSALSCVRSSASAYRKEMGFGTSYYPIEELRKSISGWQTDNLTKGRKLSFQLQFQALFMLFPFLKSLVSKAFRLRVMSHDYFPLYSGKYYADTETQRDLSDEGYAGKKSHLFAPQEPTGARYFQPYLVSSLAINFQRYLTPWRQRSYSN